MLSNIRTLSLKCADRISPAAGYYTREILRLPLRPARANNRLLLDLAKYGVFIMRSYFHIPPQLRIRLAELSSSLDEYPWLHYSSLNKVYWTHFPDCVHSVLNVWAQDDNIQSMVRGYFRREVSQVDMDFKRVMPLDMAEQAGRNEKFDQGHSSSHWHHDTVGSQIKALVYLTDVGPGAQNFAYCLKSHGWKPYGYARSRWSDEKVTNAGFQIRECYGPAGTVILFDSNGIHRIRRSITAPIRDSVTWYYQVKL